jgi:hypothetical protein
VGIKTSLSNIHRWNWMESMEIEWNGDVCFGRVLNKYLAFRGEKGAFEGTRFEGKFDDFELRSNLMLSHENVFICKRF